MSIKYHVHFPYKSDLPDKIYKYISFEEHHIRSLLTDELYFNSPESFNDPYEPYLLFEGNSRYGVNLKDDLEKAAISCFSRTNDNFTLWSYYANGMKGICIEFDTEELISSITSHFQAQWLYTFDVNYLAATENSFGLIPVVNQTNLIESDYEKKGPELTKIFATKPSLFSSENEFRLVIRPGPDFINRTSMCGLYPYSRNSITGVIFGSKTRANDIKLVEKILGNQISYQVAKTNLQHYSINIEQKI